MQVCTHGDALGGLGYHLAVQADLGFEVDEVAGQAGGEFIGLDGAAVGVGLGQVAGNEIGCGLVGGNVAQGQAFAHQGAGGGAIAEQFGVVAIAQAVAELVLQGPGYGGDLATLLYDGVGDGARQQGGGEDGDDLFADDVAYGGVGLLAVDVGFEAGLVAVELALDGGLVEVLHPALLFVDGGTVLCGVEKGLGVQGYGGLQVHPRAVAVLLGAGIQRHPGVQGAVGVDVLAGGGVAVASAGSPVDVGLHPGVFHADATDAAGLRDASGGNAALVEQAQRCSRGLHAAHPVHGLADGHVDGADLVAGGDAGCTQQCNLQAGGVEGVAALFVQGVLGALHGTPGGYPFDVVAHPVVDGHGVVAQFCGFGPDAGGELHLGGFGQVGLKGGLAGIGWDVELDTAYAGCTGQMDFLVFVEVLVPGGAGLCGGALGGRGVAPGQLPPK